jgi:hypothetical protein
MAGWAATVMKKPMKANESSLFAITPLLWPGHVIAKRGVGG